MQGSQEQLLIWMVTAIAVGVICGLFIVLVGLLFRRQQLASRPMEFDDLIVSNCLGGSSLRCNHPWEDSGPA
ncbi:hypothetical protein [Lyngbya confervoides]|uniref:Uncharacterized protein n=1 Tax=Lyngbya confervoides BDU141951 TaxID=1574623 RepID=A0ABD4SYI7_9CYAN|nr:hypothetical protein [Lyngbya confervoides]MCM1981423.1 hypothetical protein [Lyngbya confervoides BDU141951]